MRELEQDSSATWAEHAADLGESAREIADVPEREPAHDAVDRGVPDGDGLGAGDERRVTPAESGSLETALGDPEEAGGEIEPDDPRPLVGRGQQPDGAVARPGADVERQLPSAETSQGDGAAAPGA